MKKTYRIIWQLDLFISVFNYAARKLESGSTIENTSERCPGSIHLESGSIIENTNEGWPGSLH